jgi:hypothetical protein
VALPLISHCDQNLGECVVMIDVSHLETMADASHQVNWEYSIALGPAPVSASADLHFFTTGSSGLSWGKRLRKVTPCNTAQEPPQRLLQQC